MTIAMETAGNHYHVSPARQSYVGGPHPATYNGAPPEFRESVHYMEGSFSDNQSGTVFIRVSIPEIKVQVG